MAQDAELKLKVSLDLAFFRQQLSTISTQLGGQSVPIAIKFDKKAIADQYRLLDRYIRGKKFTVELNLVGGLTKNEFNKIKGRLDDLRELRKVEIPIGIKNGATGKNVDEVVASIKERLAKNQQIKQGGGKLRIETSIKPSITNQDIADLKKAAKDKLSKIGTLEIATKLETPKVEDLLKALQKNLNRQKPLFAKTSIKPSILRADVQAFKKAVEEKLSGITVKVKAELEGISKQPFSAGPTGLAGLQEYMRSQGMQPAGGAEAKRRAMFENVVENATSKELKRMTQQANIAGRSKLTTSAQMKEALLQINDAAMEGILGNLQMRMKDPLPIKRGFLDQIARAVFWMAGVDPEYLRQQAAQRRALPRVNFPATTPSRTIPIGPSETGRALPASRAAAGIIGAAQSPVGLLPSITRKSSIQAGIESIFAAGGPRFPEGATGKLALSTEALQDRVNKQLNEYFKVVEATIKEVFNPQDLKRALNIFSYLPQALRDAETRTRQARIGIPSAQGIAGLLPAATGRAPSTYATGAIGGESREQMMARRTAEAYARSALRGMDVMGGGAGRPPSPYSYAYRSARPTSAIIPYAQPGAIVPSPVAGEGGAAPPAGGGGGMRGMGGMGGFGRALGGIGNLPGAGTIKELGSEFGFATKQVLLFGQAYKLLAFAQDFPAQVGAAVSQLQSFRNTLLSVTGSAGAAADANEFILAAVEKYSIPLQSARDGFTKLFASMEPAGFAAGEIQNLFLGISKAAATYGMSADKVDRVNYAFAQMASKGQVMSEELKGQLGDVLPGAMGIFAKAAGFEGADAIQKFGKALEDGEYKGGKMRELLRNVANEMNKEFGPGAEGAARTFQGAINRMQTATAKLYESFEPAAIGVMNAVMVPFVQTLKNATDGVNAYFSGQEAATPAAQSFANTLKTLVPTLAGIGENLKYVFQQVAVLVQGFGAFALQVGRLLALPVVRYLAGAYVQTLLLTTAFKALAASGIGAALVAIVRFIAQGIIYAQMMLGMRVATQQTTVAMYQFGTTVQTVMIKSVIGIALVAISAFIARIVELRGQLAAISGDAKSMEDLAKSSAKLGDVSATKEALGNIKDHLETYRQLKREIASAKPNRTASSFASDRAAISSGIEVSTATARKLVELGVINAQSLSKTASGYSILEANLTEVNKKIDENIASFDKAGQKGSQYIDQAIKQNKKLQEQGSMGAEAPDDAALKKAQQAAEKAANQQQQLAMDAAKRQNDLDKARFEHLVSMNESDFDHWKSLQDDKFNYEIAGMNSIEARQRKFQKDLQDIEIRRIETIRKAELETAKAVQESQAAARVSAAAGGGVTGLYQGSTGISSGAHFDIRRADRSRITEAEARALLDPSVSRQLQMTSGYGRRVSPVPGASSFHAGIDLAGPANTPLNLAPGYSLQGVGQEGGLGYTANVRGPQGEMYKVGHLQPPGASYTRQRRAEGAGGKQDVTQINVAYKATEQLTNVQNAYDLALKETATTIKSNIASIFPVAELQLETSLMKIRNQLQLQGMPAEYIKYKEESFKAEYEAAEAVKKHKENISEFEQRRDSYTKKQQEGVELTGKERQELDYLNKQIALNKEGMAALTEQQKAYNIASLESAIATMKQADALKAMEEVSGRINDAVTGVTDTYKSMFKEIAMGEDSVEALKKAQQALADQFLTMVFDMAMKPVEESMKNSLAKMFGVPTEKEKREESIKKMEEQLTQLKLIENNTAIAAGKAPASGATATPAVPGQMTATGTSGGFLTGTAALQTLPFNGQTGGMLQNLPFPAGDTGFLSSIGINGEELSASISESANAYSEQLSKVDNSVFESANALGTAGTELGKEGAAGKKWHESLGQAVGGLGMAAGAVMGIVAGINQIKEGGTSNVLGGIGMIASMAGSLLGNFGGLFGGGGGASSIVQGTDIPIAQMPAGMQFANGGVAFGGFRAFANGGTVSGPTLGLVGEGKYNEAIVPLPDGRSIPVQLGGRSARDLMGNGAPGMPQAPSLSMKFETTKINGVEYVSREQLEQAMAETRRASIAGGAQRGMSMTLDKIKQSPSTRSSIGIR